MPYATNAHGMLIGASIHDARTTAIFLEEHRVVLTLRPETGDPFSIAFTACARVGTRRLQNVMIVDHVFVWPVAAVPESELASEDGAWPVLFANELPLPEVPRAAASLQAREPSRLLAKVESSYGGTLAVLCQDLEILHNAARSPDLPDEARVR